MLSGFVTIVNESKSLFRCREGRKKFRRKAVCREIAVAPCERKLTTIDHFTYYCLGSQGGKLWVVMRLLGPIPCRKVCRNTAEITENDWSVVLNRRLPVSTFLQTIGLDAATSSPLIGLRSRSIVLPLELNVRVISRRRNSLPSQTLVLSLQLPRRDKFAKSLQKQESRSRNTRNVRKKWSVYLPPRMWECQLKSCALAYSLLRTWKETTISWGIHFWIVCRPVGSSLESVGYWVKGESSAKSVLRTRKEAGRTWEVLVGWQWWPLKTSCSWWPVWGSGSGGCSRSWHTFLVCRRLVCHSPFKKWITFLCLRLGRLPPWPSWEDVKASMAECFHANYPATFIVLDATELCPEIRSCLALQSQLYSSYNSRTTLEDLNGISPNGSIYFVSELWSGSISDRELVIKSVMLSFKKNFIITFTSSVTIQLFFFYFLSSFICCWLIRMIASQASCFVFQKKKKFLSLHSQALFSFNPPFF